MTIRQKMITWLLLIAGVVVFSNSFFLYKHWREAERAAIEDAENTAQALALGLSFADETRGFSSMYKTPAKVQNYIEHIHSNLKEDIVVVDSKKKIVGDAVPKDVGKIFDHDKNNEVGQTISDGLTRTFIERSSDFAAGFGRLLVIQVKSDEGEPVGALILEYTSYYNKYRAEVIYDLKTDLTISFIVLFMALVIGYFMSMNVTNPILRLKKASDELASGNLEIKVELKARDELGDLAAAFNSMAALRKAAEDGLKESEQRFMQLFMDVSIPLGFANKDGIILYFNVKFTEAFGYTVDDIPTLKGWWETAYPDESYRRWVLDTWNVAVDKALQEGTDIESVEYKVTCKNGTERIVIIGGHLSQGGVIATFNDITERKMAEDELKRVYAELQEKAEYLERFNRLMVGRELEMIKLKAEVNALLEKAGQLKKYEAPDEAREGGMIY